MSDFKVERRNIHTYPFKYSRVPPKQLFAPDEAAIYVHIPFCPKKCHFCDYLVLTKSDPELHQQYVDSVCMEISRFPSIPCFPRFRIDALYIGGGTPGMLEADQLIQIVDACRELYELTEGAELCVEFDPSTVTFDKVRRLHQAGFNRLSLGVQCFDDETLSSNNRSHNVAMVYSAYDDIRRAGFEHVNIDILYPLLGQTFEQWEHTVDRAVDLQPANITAYPLELWPHTAYQGRLARGERLPGWDVEQRMTRYAYDRLEAARYRRNSTGGYYHPDRAKRYCRFLDYYWRTWPMIGFGAAAKSVIYDRLYVNIGNVREYIQRIADGAPVVDFSTRMSRAEEMRRLMIRGLKQCQVGKQEFQHRFGVPMELVFGEEIRRLVERGFLLDLEDRIELTRKGQIHDRTVYATFYTEEDLRPPRNDEIQYGISNPLDDEP